MTGSGLTTGGGMKVLFCAADSVTASRARKALSNCMVSLFDKI